MLKVRENIARDNILVPFLGAADPNPEALKVLEAAQLLADALEAVVALEAGAFDQADAPQFLLQIIM